MVNFKELTDLQLADLLRSGSTTAFRNLFERYKAALFSFSYHKINNKELAQDMIQSTFAELWENRSTIKIPGRFESYIFTIVRNKIIDHYRHKKVSRRYRDNIQQYLEITEDSTDHRIRHNELARLIEIEIEALPEHLKEVFLLSRNTSLSRKQIAGKLNLSEEGVKTRMHRALKILKKRLGNNMHFL